jgi:hypothetical protein
VIPGAKAAVNTENAPIGRTAEHTEIATLPIVNRHVYSLFMTGLRNTGNIAPNEFTSRFASVPPPAPGRVLQNPAVIASPPADKITRRRLSCGLLRRQPMR